MSALRGEADEDQRPPELPLRAGTLISRPSRPHGKTWLGTLQTQAETGQLDNPWLLQQSVTVCCTVQYVRVMFFLAGYLQMAQKHKLNRISVGLSDREHAELLALSEKHRVSLAWLGRQAIGEFLERYRNRELQLPLTLERTERKASNG